MCFVRYWGYPSGYFIIHSKSSPDIQIKVFKNGREKVFCKYLPYEASRSLPKADGAPSKFSTSSMYISLSLNTNFSPKRYFGEDLSRKLTLVFLIMVVLLTKKIKLRYRNFCWQYRRRTKPKKTCHWGNRFIEILKKRIKTKVSPAQLRLYFDRCQVTNLLLPP